MGKAPHMNSPYIHVFHTHYDIARVVLEGTVECNNPVVVAVMHDAQLSYYPFPHLVLCLDMYDLKPSQSCHVSHHPRHQTHLPCHCDFCGGMLHLAHGPPVPGTEFTEDYQVLCFQIQPKLYTDLKCVCPPGIIIP